jgi:hypothetical protein
MMCISHWSFPCPNTTSLCSLEKDQSCMMFLYPAKRMPVVDVFTRTFLQYNSEMIVLDHSIAPFQVCSTSIYGPEYVASCIHEDLSRSH